MGKATDATYGWLISKYIESRGISTERIAEELGMSTGEVEILFANGVDLPMYKRICEVLGTSADMFVGGAWALEVSGALDDSGIPKRPALA